MPAVVTHMRKLIAGLAALAVVGGMLVLGLGLAMAGPGACPTALLQGTLVEREGTLAVASIPGGAIVEVTWPFGYGVDRSDGTLTLTRVFMPVAAEGDEVSLGGGADGPGSRRQRPLGRRPPPRPPRGRARGSPPG